MPYSLIPDDKTPTDALRRIAHAELSDALKLAQDPGSSSPLHALRKSVKKTRGLLRLLRPVFADFTTENAALRDAAAGISALRDAEVMRLTLDTLAALPGDPRATEAAATMRAQLPPMPDTGPDHSALARFVEDIAQIRHRAEHWKAHEKGWHAYAPGLELTLHQSQKRMKIARKTLADSDFHRWRSRIKHHWYQTRLLAPIWPEMMAPHSAIADHLGELLGEHHDLAVLRRAIPAHLPEIEAAALDQLIGQGQRTREAEAFHLGARLLGEEPAALSARWGHWYQLWRSERG
jgi:CHAD domain-containing protein